MYKIEEPELPKVAKHSFITRQQPLLNDVCERYGRNPEDTCLKVFYGNPLKRGETLKDALWGDNHDPTNPNHVRKNTKLLVGSAIQNICWKHNLSPRVFAVFEAEYQDNRVAVQLTEYIKDGFARTQQEADGVYKQIEELGKYYKFGQVKAIHNWRDVMNGKAVDLQPFAYSDEHEEKIKEIYANKGRYGKVYYQDVPEVGLQGGPRKSEDRIQYMQLDKINFEGKVVWDIGCAGGFFCRYAFDRGAKRVVGFDTPDTVEGAFYMTNYLNKFNIDYVGVDLENHSLKDQIKPDIVFFLSMNYHIKPPQRIFEAETIIFEDNGKETRNMDVPGNTWTSQYNYELVGRGEDHGDKACYHLIKK